jgi:Protein of unknown function (DUF2384)
MGAYLSCSALLQSNQMRKRKTGPPKPPHRLKQVGIAGKQQSLVPLPRAYARDMEVCGEGFTPVAGPTPRFVNEKSVTVRLSADLASLRTPRKGKPGARVNFDSTVAKATELLGSEAEALRWLGTPVAALDFATPISLLGTPKGAGRVHDVLTQMEHGVW